MLEPLQAAPTIIEDNCFIGARAEVAEGVIVGEGSVLSMGVYLSASTKIVDRATGEIIMGKVPPYSVVVSGSLPAAAQGAAVALLRRDRQAGGREDPRQDLDQRIAAGLTGRRSAAGADSPFRKLAVRPYKDNRLAKARPQEGGDR